MATIFKAEAKVNKDDSVNRKDLEDVLEVLLEAVKRHKRKYISQPEFIQYVDEDNDEKTIEEKMIFKLNKKESCIIITTDEKVKVKIVRK